MVDWDDVLSYRTVRIVKIRDKRLFFLYAFFVLLIVIYMIVWNFGHKMNHLKFEEPLGTVRTSLKAPGGPYKLPVSELPYCGSDVYIGTDWHVFAQKPCKVADSKFVVYPPSEETAMLCTSRVSAQKQTLPSGCDEVSTDPKCVWKDAGAETDFLIAQLENYTLFVDHTMDAPQSELQRNSKYMEGRLTNLEGHTFDPCDEYGGKDSCPPWINIGQYGKADIMQLGTLLRAAGVTMDEHAHASRAIGKSSWESRRYSGIVILMRIFYDNIQTFNTNNIRYTYQVMQVPNTEYKVEEPQVSGTTRTIIDRHGIRIIFQQTGKIGVFDIQTLLINLVAAMGLLAVATICVDFLATKVLAQKDFYEECKFMVPVDEDTYKQSGRTFHEPPVVAPILRDPSV